MSTNSILLNLIIKLGTSLKSNFLPRADICLCSQSIYDYEMESTFEAVVCSLAPYKKSLYFRQKSDIKTRLCLKSRLRTVSLFSSVSHARERAWLPKRVRESFPLDTRMRILARFVRRSKKKERLLVVYNQ